MRICFVFFQQADQGFRFHMVHRRKVDVISGTGINECGKQRVFRSFDSDSYRIFHGQHKIVVLFPDRRIGFCRTEKSLICLRKPKRHIR